MRESSLWLAEQPLAESGWPEQVMEDELPFGIGFFSVCFAADRVRVRSRSHQITFSSEDLIAKRPVVVEPCLHFNGTCIVLEGCKLNELEIRSKLRYYAKGFAIRIFWQGEELPRPHAKAVLSGTDTPVGFVYAPGIHTRKIPQGCPNFILYCQGLPVRGFCSFFSCFRDDNNVIIHVDHKRYRARMPDRSELVDEIKVRGDFRDQLNTLWRETLLQEKAYLDGFDFASSYWQIARRTGCLDLMCDVPVIPASQISLFTRQLRFDYQAAYLTRGSWK